MLLQMALRRRLRRQNKTIRSRRVVSVSAHLPVPHNPRDYQAFDLAKNKGFGRSDLERPGTMTTLGASFGPSARTIGNGSTPRAARSFEIPMRIETVEFKNIRGEDDT
jgi:hypothetical protein